MLSKWLFRVHNKIQLQLKTIVSSSKVEEYRPRKTKLYNTLKSAGQSLVDTVLASMMTRSRLTFIWTQKSRDAVWSLQSTQVKCSNIWRHGKMAVFAKRILHIIVGKTWLMFFHLAFQRFQNEINAK